MDKVLYEINNDPVSCSLKVTEDDAGNMHCTVYTQTIMWAGICLPAGDTLNCYLQDELAQIKRTLKTLNKTNAISKKGLKWLESKLEERFAKLKKPKSQKKPIKRLEH